MTAHRDAPCSSKGGVQHADRTGLDGDSGPAPSAPFCARCGGPLSLTLDRRPRAGIRYCTAACRFADVRERRAAARADLIAALADLRAAEARVESALRVLGLHPSRPRSRPKEHA